MGFGWIDRAKHTGRRIRFQSERIRLEFEVDITVIPRRETESTRLRLFLSRRVSWKIDDFCRPRKTRWFCWLRAGDEFPDVFGHPAVYLHQVKLNDHEEAGGELLTNGVPKLGKTSIGGD